MRESLPLGKAGLVRWVRLLLSTLGPTQAFGALTSTRAAYFLLVVCIDMAFKRILVATDFSESAERALDLAVEMARKFDAELTLVHSWEVPYAYGDALHVTVDLIMSLQEAAQKHLDAALVELKQRFPNAKSDLRTGSPWEEILTAATDGGAGSSFSERTADVASIGLCSAASQRRWCGWPRYRSSPFTAAEISSRGGLACRRGISSWSGA